MGRNRRNSRHFVFVAADIVRLLALIGFGVGDRRRHSCRPPALLARAPLVPQQGDYADFTAAVLID